MFSSTANGIGNLLSAIFDPLSFILDSTNNLW